MSKTRTQRAQKTESAARQKALLCARLALEKKAYSMTVLDMGSLTSIADYFVICSGKSVRQTRAIADHVRFKMKALRHNPLGVEGESEGCWILLDYDDVVVHVFHEPTREFYTLEKLWSDAAVVQDPELEEALKARDVGLGREEEGWED